MLLDTGAYGTAVLYKKKDDDSLVILKEINLHDLNVTERQLAQNEVQLIIMMIIGIKLVTNKRVVSYSSHFYLLDYL